MNIYPPGTRIAERYEVASRPLMGGMGIVYLCFDRHEGRPVALKTFKPEYLPDRVARDRFLREGTTWVNLGNHPHIVRCYQVIHVGLEVYLVLELVAKEKGRTDASLRSWLLPGQRLPLAQALSFGLQIARGMVHATVTIQGFVHRDLKPENILVGSDQLSGTGVNRLRVTDFGLARVLQEASERIGESAISGRPSVADSPQGTVSSRLGRTQLTRGIVGTLLYMAPEQWQREEVAMQTDMYALGCILYEMLTGQRAVEGNDLAELERAHCVEGIRPLPTRLPESVREVVANCLARDPGARYSRWEAVEEALSAAYAEVTGLSVPAPESSQVLNRTERVTAGWSYNAIGMSYHNIGKYDVAVGYFERVVQMGQAEQDRRLEAAGQSGLGIAYRELGDARRAVRLFEQWLAIVREIEDRVGEGYALGCLGTAYRALGDTQKAIKFQEQCLTILQEIDDQAGKGSALGDLGNAYLSLGDLEQAIRLFEQRLAIVQKIRDRHGVGQALGSLGHAYRLLGDAQQAVEYCQKGLAIMREIGDRAGEGITLGHLGAAYATLGDTRRAIEFFKQDLMIAQEIGNRAEEGIALGNLGVVYAKSGDIRQAIRFFEQSLAVASEIGNRREEANVLGNLALAYDNLGDSPRAMRFYRQSLAIAQEIGDMMAAANTSFNLALLLTRQSEWTDALRHAEFAAKVFTQIKHKPMLQKIQQLLNTLHVVQSDPADAQAYYNRGNVYVSLQRNDEALADFTQAIQLDPTYAPAYLNIGILLANRGKLREALPYLERAAQLGIPQGTQHATQIRQRLGSVSASQVNPTQLAFEAFQRAGSLDEMRRTAAQFPFMTAPNFIAAIQQAIAQQVPQNFKAAFNQRLAWLRQVVNEQK